MPTSGAGASDKPLFCALEARGFAVERRFNLGGNAACEALLLDRMHAFLDVDAWTKDVSEQIDVMVGFRLPYIIGPDTEPLENKIRNLEKYADKVISKM